MNETLPLFEGLEPAPPAGRAGLTVRSARAARTRPGTASAAAASRPAAFAVDRAPEAPPDHHLRAAWRLSRAMWRFPDYSPQQTRAGLAICEHLQALLAQSQEPRKPTR